jgi:hypothetical protein
VTPERFRAIVDAYGADPRRWPEAERAQAREWAALHRGEAEAVLAEATCIDAWLGSAAVAPPDDVLHRRIVASAPGRRRLRQPARVWWSGVAAAGIGLAGGLAGALAVSFFVLTGRPPAAPDSAYLTTSFGGSAVDWSGE